eukprot:847784_1
MSMLFDPASADVLCPAQPPSNYCDCEGDCTGQPEWCSCDEAQKCCEGATPVVLCPGQPKENYCDCTGDCHNQPDWCSCDEGQRCCNDNGFDVSPDGEGFLKKLVKMILPFGD